MTEFLFLLLGSVLGFFVARSLSSNSKELKMQMDTFTWQMSQDINILKAEINSIKKAPFVDEIKKAPNVLSKDVKKPPGANRHPRTEEQRKAAADKKKAWWAAQRAAKAAKEAQVQMIPTPIEAAAEINAS